MTRRSLLRLVPILLLLALALACNGTREGDKQPVPDDTSISRSIATMAARDALTGTATALAGASATPAPASTFPPGLVQARVVRVVDGDTIEADIALGPRATIRYIGVDTPETVAPGRPVDCFGREASDRNKQLVEDKTIYLEKDVSETDRFGRLLRYVYLENGEMVNELLVRDGYAQVSTFPPDVNYQERFLAAQREAREANRGLWGACQAPAATPVPSERQQPVPPPPGASPPAGTEPQVCDASYPDVCIPPPPPDLDCPQIPHRRFRVLPPDPHRFDADRDGIGCES